AGTGRAADELRELLAARDLHAAPVEEAGRLGAQRSVHEHLQVAEADERAPEAAADIHRTELFRVVGRERLPDPQGERSLGLELLPEAKRAEPAVLVVNG